jgi:hypothetical protein
MSESEGNGLRRLLASISPPSVVVGPRIAAPSSNMNPSEVPAIANPGTALPAMVQFFKDRHLMGRDEFLRIMRKCR